MDEAAFWRIVGLFDWSQSDEDDVLATARDTLSGLPVTDIARFDDLLAEKLYALDTREHCRYAYLGERDPDNGDDYISPDDFLYLRCAVVGQGREVYQAVLAQPSQMPQHTEFEGLLYLAASAHEQATDTEYDHVTAVSWESFSNEEGWRPTTSTSQGTATGPDVPRLNRRPS